MGILDRCNGDRASRSFWCEMAGLSRDEVIVLHFDVPEEECASRVARRGVQHKTLKVSSLVEATNTISSHALHFEAPMERECFKGIVRMKGGAKAIQELVHSWTQGSVVEADDLSIHQSTEGGEKLPELVEWMEAEKRRRQCAWDVPRDSLLFQDPQAIHGTGSSLARVASTGNTWNDVRPPAMEQFLIPANCNDSLSCTHNAASREHDHCAWRQPGMRQCSQSGELLSSSETQRRQEEEGEEEDCAERNEALAVMLRCLGFDEAEVQRPF